MTIKWLAVPVMAMAMCAVGSSPSRAYAAQETPVVGDHGGWDVPPAEFRDVQRQGFHDGIEGARKDFDHHRPSNVNGRDEYRHPHVDASARDDYREGYRRGYEVAMQHMTDKPGE